jgi:RNA polymerase sigma-70 factor (ECF subfamily)
VEEQLDRQLSALMALAQAGDRQAYQTALAQVARIVRDYARRRLGEAAVDDVVQETLISVHRALHTYDPQRPFGPWLYTIARHRISDVARREQRWLRAETEASSLSPAVIAPEPGNAHFLNVAMARLSDRQREVIELLKLAGRSVEEAATETGLSRRAVKVTAHRGLRRLRVLLARGNQ